jgi:hypothetical protein
MSWMKIKRRDALKFLGAGIVASIVPQRLSFADETLNDKNNDDKINENETKKESECDKIDIVHLFDRSHSMENKLGTMLSCAEEIIYEVWQGYDRPRFGVSCVGYNNHAYEKIVSLTKDKFEAIEALYQIKTVAGMKEKFSEALYETFAFENWRPDAKKYVILYTDEIPEDIMAEIVTTKTALEMAGNEINLLSVLGDPMMSFDYWSKISKVAAPYIEGKEFLSPILEEVIGGCRRICSKDYKRKIDGPTYLNQDKFKR